MRFAFSLAGLKKEAEGKQKTHTAHEEQWRTTTEEDPQGLRPDPARERRAGESVVGWVGADLTEQLLAPNKTKV